MRLASGLLLASILLGGCSPSKKDPPQPQSDKAIFVANCASCHTLTAAASNGQAGPSLDQTRLSVAQIKLIIDNGRGTMPAFRGQLSRRQINDVADYIARVSRR